MRIWTSERHGGYDHGWTWGVVEHVASEERWSHNLWRVSCPSEDMRIGERDLRDMRDM